MAAEEVLRVPGGLVLADIEPLAVLLEYRGVGDFPCRRASALLSYLIYFGATVR